MSTTTAPPVAVPQQLTRPTVPEERGTTTIPERVIAKLAGRAAAEVTETHVLSSRIRTLTGRAPKAASVEVHRDGTMVTLRMGIAIGYPTPVRRAAQEVRDHVRQRVREFTGLTVRQVDIDVVDLVREGARR